MNASTPLYLIHTPECRRLYAEGVSKTDIARRLGISHNTVAYALTDDAGRAKIIARKKISKVPSLGWVHSIDPVPREPRKISSSPISKEVFNAAILAFAKHEISREQMMFRITPQDKWRGKSWEEM
jgi:predicted transcriptional regulator